MVLAIELTMPLAKDKFVNIVFQWCLNLGHVQYSDGKGKRVHMYKVISALGYDYLLVSLFGSIRWPLLFTYTILQS